MGRLPDVTASSTGAHGILSGTAFWRPDMIRSRIGVAKATYMSSVGSAQMLSNIHLSQAKFTESEIAALEGDEQFAAWVRMAANEFGTTTGRPRDICRLDLDLLRYHIKVVGGINCLAVTHLDIARPDMAIPVVSHYIHKVTGRRVPAQPGIQERSTKLEPVVYYLPGWDGTAVQRARSVNELPREALRYLSFLQRQVGVPIVFVTTGPRREQAFTV
ncbi:MAG: adenylosuccinate synthetase [Patescibacteria group bacterium]|nr:adenylosuccinate synthetase [Patescibacteria group bacterium]